MSAFDPCNETSQRFPHDQCTNEELQCPPTISNPGAVCYITSFLQQLFTIPQVRSLILSANLDLITDCPYKVRVVQELEELFQKLNEQMFQPDDEKQSCDPTDFCEAFFEFQHVKNTSQPKRSIDDQGDVISFITDILGILDDLSICGSFKGIKSVSIESCIGTEDTKHSKLQKETFFYLSVVIKKSQHISSSKINTLSLLDTLREYFKPLVLDYPWKTESNMSEDHRESDKLDNVMPKSDKKTISLPSIVKTKLHMPPPYLLIHLQRFRFNVTKMCTEKQGNYCHFPHVLDLSEYYDSCSNDERGEHGDASSCRYELCGFIVHEGSAVDGHYYSFVKHRLCTESQTQKPSEITSETLSAPNMVTSSISPSSNWFEVDDELADEFRIEFIDDEAFGDDNDTDFYPTAVVLMYEKI